MRNILSLMLLVLVASVANAQQDSAQEVESKSNDLEEQVFFAIEKRLNSREEIMLFQDT